MNYFQLYLVNTQAAADVVDCSNTKNSKYYVVVVMARACDVVNPECLLELVMNLTL